MKKYTRDDTEHGKDYYLASEVDALVKHIAADPKAFHGFPSGSVSTPNAGGKCVTAGETAPKEST